MSTPLYFVINVFILPIVIIIGEFAPISIAIFWFSSLIFTIFYLKVKLKDCSLLQLLSPCIITYIYSILNYSFGAFYYSFDVLSGTRLYIDFFNISHFNLFLILFYLNLCNTIMVLLGIKYTVRYSKKEIVKAFSKINIINIAFLLLFFILLHVFIFDFSILGGNSFSTEAGGAKTGLNYPLILGIIVLIAYQLNSYQLKILIRGLFYLFIILVMAVDSVGSKRELLFALIAIGMVELIVHEKKLLISFKTFIIGVTTITLFVFYILSASIVRGYGSFGADNLIDAVEYVPEYVQSDYFYEVVGGNFETPGHYGKSVLACEYVLEGKIPILFGETFYKVLFIPIPRYVFGYKPRPMVDVFTLVYDPLFRKSGGSTPVSAYSEFFANFHIFGLLFLCLFFLFCQKLYIKMINQIRIGRYGYIYLVPFFSLYLHFVRGSGLETTIVYSILAAFSMFVVETLSDVFNNNNNYKKTIIK